LEQSQAALQTLYQKMTQQSRVEAASQ
jgi:hypothetical protein